MAVTRQKRNWKTLTNGKEHKLVRGKDFNTFLSMRTAIYNRAKEFGMSAKTRVEGDTLFVKFIKK
jgi:hypothetical protein